MDADTAQALMNVPPAPSIAPAFSESTHEGLAHQGGSADHPDHLGNFRLVVTLFMQTTKIQTLNQEGPDMPPE
jgi:hypothetical protein